MPPPHPLEQPDQPDTSQFIGGGHDWVLQFCVVVVGHALPPFAACLLMIKFCLPGPEPSVHGLEQGDHEDIQSIGGGHLSVLHVLVISDAGGQGAPPYAGGRKIVRV